MPHATLLNGYALAITDTDEYSLAGIERVQQADIKRAIKIAKDWKE